MQSMELCERFKMSAAKIRCSGEDGMRVDDMEENGRDRIRE